MKKEQTTLSPWEIIDFVENAIGDPKSCVTVLPCILAAIQLGGETGQIYREDIPTDLRMIDLIMETENQHRGTKFWQDMADTSRLSWLVLCMKYATMAAAGKPEEELREWWLE